jgi:hypothetical protein
MKTFSRLSWSLVLVSGTLLCGPVVAPAQPADRPPDDARAYLEMLRSDFNATKVRTINQAMQLTGPEAEAFWPIYRQYEKDLAAVGDQKLALIREFMTAHKNGSLTNPSAKSLSERWLKNTQARLDLWNKYYKKISKALSPVRGAQFLQIENQVALFVDMSIASEMPAIGLPAAAPAATK